MAFLWGLSRWAISPECVTRGRPLPPCRRLRRTVRAARSPRAGSFPTETLPVGKRPALRAISRLWANESADGPTGHSAKRNRPPGVTAIGRRPALRNCPMSEATFQRALAPAAIVPGDGGGRTEAGDDRPDMGPLLRLVDDGGWLQQRGVVDAIGDVSVVDHGPQPGVAASGDDGDGAFDDSTDGRASRRARRPRRARRARR